MAVLVIADPPQCLADSIGGGVGEGRVVDVQGKRLESGVRAPASLAERSPEADDLVLKPQPTPEQIQHVLERIEALGFTPHLSQGVARTIIGT